MNIVRKLKFLTILVLASTIVFGQSNINQNKSNSGNIIPKPLDNSDLEKFNSIPVLRLPQSYKNTSNGLLPDSLDNSILPFWRPVFNQVALECGQASGIGQGFTYEINYERGLHGNMPNNQYPTHFAWNFANSGYNHGVSFFDTWEVLRDFGTPNVSTYGGMYIPGGGARIWVDGYDYYYNGMKNRIDGVYAIPTDTEEGFLTLKHWLDDHLENAAHGGVANFYANVPPIIYLAAGTPQAGKPCVVQWGNYASHGMTIMGYNDSIRYDYNGDGLFTNDLDINNDGIVDMKDWEVGAFRFANNYGGGPNWGDNGFAYMMYRNLAFPNNQGGIWSQKVYVLKTRESVDPVLTMKIHLRHTSRNKIKVYAGMSTDTTSTTPEITKDYAIFNYQGGDYYMVGGTSEANKELEFGLDISDFLNELDSGQPAKFFLLIDEDDPSSLASGDLISFSLINYNNSGTEVLYTQSNIPLNNNDLSLFPIVTSVNFSSPVIVTDSLTPSIVNEPYISTLIASGGTSPYFWEMDKDYKEDISAVSYPAISTQLLTPNNYNTGTAIVNIGFSFPFHDIEFSEIVVHTDGYLLLDENLYNWPYLVSSDLFALTKKRIAPFEADLMYNTALGHGLWYEGNTTYAHIRWKGYFYGQSETNTVDFSVKLHENGKIEFYYGDMLIPSGTEWLSVIYSGNHNQIQKLSINESSAITNGTLIELSPPFIPDDLFLTSDGIVKGIPMDLTPPTPLRVKLTDACNIITKKEIFYSTSGINSLIIQNVNVNSGGDQVVEPGENAIVSLEVRNVVSGTISNSNLIISTSNLAVQLIDSVEYLGNITAGDTLLLSNAFEFNLTQAVENLSNLIFETTIYCATDTFISHFNLPATSPGLRVAGIIVNDNGNGCLEPGETAELIVYVENTGESDASNITMNFSSVDPYFYITNPNASISLLTPNQLQSVVLNVYVSSLAGILTSLTTNFNADWGYSSTDLKYINLIFLGDDFETGDFTQLNWIDGGDDYWLADDTVVYEGIYSARSAYITHNEESSLTLEINVGAEGHLGFYKKVSSEANYDYLRFSINGAEIDKWAGNQDWSHEIYPFDQGVYVLKWNYTKDYSVNGGLDGAWLDYITLPILQELFVSIDETDIKKENSSLSAYPNPFNIACVINFNIKNTEEVSIQIIDINGKLVRSLIYSEIYSKGDHSVFWDGKDNWGEELSQGIYIVKLTTTKNNHNIRLVKVK